MKIRIERLSDRVNLLDAMLLEHAHQWTIGQLHALAHCLGRRIRGFRRGLEAKLETVSHSQQLRQQLFGRVLEAARRIAFEPPPRVLKIGPRATGPRKYLGDARGWWEGHTLEIGSASWRERVCQYV